MKSKSLHTVIRSLIRLAHLSILGISLVCLIPLSAQTVWDPVDQNWINPNNWTAGVPNLNGVNPVNFQIGNIPDGLFPIIEIDDYRFSAPASNIFAVSTVGSGSSTTARLDIRSGSLRRDDAEDGYGNFAVAANGVGPVLNIANTAVTGQSNFSTFGLGSGSLTVREFLIGAFAGSLGTVNVNTTGSIRATQSIFVGSEGNGVLNLSGGSLNTDNFGGGLILGRNAGVTGTLNMDGGTIGTGGTADQRFIRVGRGGTGIFNQSGGTINISNNLEIGENDTASGTVNLSGGTTSVEVIRVGMAGNGVLNVSDSGALTVRNFSNSLLIGTGSDGDGTVNLNGGSITARFVRGGDGTSTFNFNGGTLIFTHFFSQAFEDLTEANILSGGAIINTNGNDVGIAQALQGSGDLTKVGAGILTLSGTNTFTGGLFVEEGTLSISSAFLDEGATVSIDSGAVLNLDFLGENTISYLILDGVAQGAGIFDSSSAFITGSGSLNVIPEPSTSAGLLGLVLAGFILLAKRPK